MKTLKQLCVPRDTIFDAAKRDTVISINQLIRGQVDPEQFFSENYMTQGMRLLLENAFKRLEGKSDQGVFRLTQSMGGGKTHNLNALGLLARFPEFRNQVMGDFYKPDAKLGRVRVVAFTGRESDAPFGIWGAVAEQVNKKEFFKDYYSPLSPPGQTAWANLLRGEPTIIMLDELPPYFAQAKAKAVGNADLSVITTAALSNLFAAIAEDLPNVAVVITDLSATSYTEGSEKVTEIIQSLADLDNEAGRHALDLEPVRMQSDEFYHILRKRIFKDMPAESEIADVSQGYAKALRDAKQMEITSVSPEQFAAQVIESYPFHPGIRDLYARFRENQGFQQTRALIRMMRMIVSSLWNDKARDPYLIAAHTMDFNDRDLMSEIRVINPSLENAITTDIAAAGNAMAERMDANLKRHDATDAAKLLLVSSLANVPGAIRGLSFPEVVTYLAEPGRDLAKLKSEVLDNFTTSAWYLHTTQDGKLYFKDVQNLVAKLNTVTKSFGREQIISDLRATLTRLFEPSDRYCYQEVMPLPAVDDIKPSQDKTILVVSYPHQDGLHPDLKAFWEQSTFQNRVFFLTGQRAFESILEASRRFKGIQSIISDMEAERVPASDPQMVQAYELRERLLGQLLMSVKETFNTIHFPTKNGLSTAEFTMRFQGNEYKGEEQIVKALTDAQKYTTEVDGDVFVKKIEARIFTQKLMPWADIKRRAATNNGWQWHRPDALDKIKAECVKKDVWRENGTYVEKGPFAKPDTDIKIQELSRDDVTGTVKLRLVPVNGDTIYAEVGGVATEASHKLDGRDYETDELSVSFLCVDSKHEHKTGPAVTWKNRITLKGKVWHNGETLMGELRAAPSAQMRYTTDGSNPRTGGAYDGPFVIPAGSSVLQAIGAKSGIESEVLNVAIPKGGAGGGGGGAGEAEIDKTKPAKWHAQHQFANTQTSYGFLGRMKKFSGSFADVQVSIAADQGNRWAELVFGEDIVLTPDVLEVMVGDLHSKVEGGTVTLRTGRVEFPTGQNLLDYVEDVKANLNKFDVEQDGKRLASKVGEEF
jgi:hypothetical protein